MPNADERAPLFGELFELAPDATVVVDATGIIELVNAQAERLFGYSRDELIGEPVEVLVPERLRDVHVARRAEFMTAPRARPMGSGLELFGRKADGSEFPIEISLSPLEVGGRLLISSSIRDVTEQRRAEQKFRALLESAPDAIVIVDEKGAIALVNAQAETLFGFSRGELIGEPIEKLIPGALPQPTPSASPWLRARPSPARHGLGPPALRLAARRQRVSRGDQPEPSRHRGGTLVSSAIRDISERKRAEAAERLASDRLLSAVEAIQDPFALYDAEDRLALCNGAFRSLFAPNPEHSARRRYLRRTARRQPAQRPLRARRRERRRLPLALPRLPLEPRRDARAPNPRRPTPPGHRAAYPGGWDREHYLGSHRERAARK